MPELPEVETVRRGLEPVMEGLKIAHVVQKRPDLRFPLPDNFAQRLTGRSVLRLERRAKYILIFLASETPDSKSKGPPKQQHPEEVLLIHLGMSGRFTIWPPKQSRDPGDKTSGPDGTGRHDHIVWDMESGHKVVYTDHRRFGYMDLIAADEIETCKHLVKLGPEPLGNHFSAHALQAALQGKRTPIKSALLDQRVVAGLGNIYVCEALHRASISPTREAKEVAGKTAKPTQRVERLTATIRSVLQEAIEAGGSTLQDYAHTDGELGYFQHRFTVYDREGEPCSKSGCKGKVARIVQSGRSTFYCETCQK